MRALLTCMNIHKALVSREDTIVIYLPNLGETIFELRITVVNAYTIPFYSSYIIIFLICNCRTAPDGCRPLDQADRLEP